MGSLDLSTTRDSTVYCGSLLCFSVIAHNMATTHLFLPPASLLPLLHAARYPSSTVIGCLVGQSQVAKDGEDSEAQDDTPTRRYEHAIPLLHHWTGLSMAVEVAMQLVRARYGSTHIVSYVAEGDGWLRVYRLKSTSACKQRRSKRSGRCSASTLLTKDSPRTPESRKCRLS